MKRGDENTHKPGEWDLPGGRLEPGEDPSLGLRRETAEEAGLKIEILIPLDVQRFERADGQMVTLIVFLCTPVIEDDDIRLSAEHTEYVWKDLTDSMDSFPSWMHRFMNNIKKYNLVKDL